MDERADCYVHVSVCPSCGFWDIWARVGAPVPEMCEDCAAAAVVDDTP